MVGLISARTHLIWRGFRDTQSSSSAEKAAAKRKFGGSDEYMGFIGAARRIKGRNRKRREGSFVLLCSISFFFFDPPKSPLGLSSIIKV